MDTGFVDLDILLTRVRNPPSKKYFLDATRAYKAGALRGALTSIWVAVVFDLIAKYRELTAMGDAAAAAFVADWDAATHGDDIRRLLQLEAAIVSDATEKTQILNRVSRTHLERLREDRNFCAHPAFSAEAELFEPSPELVRLHLVNAVELVLSQEALQGKAIFDQFDNDVQSTGFPTDHPRILDYVEQRYLLRVRQSSVINFGTVLTKSLLKGVPAQWEAESSKIASSLVAIRDRAVASWPDLAGAIVRLIDNIPPEHRLRAIAFLALFPDFWDQLENATQMTLRQTLANINAAELPNFRPLAAVRIEPLKEPILRLIEGFDEEELGSAIAAAPLAELWPRALHFYTVSGSFRGSESTFAKLVLPLAGKLDSAQNDALLDAVIANGQNWDAAQTPALLVRTLLDAAPENLPGGEARSRFYTYMHEMRRLAKYDAVFELLKADGWEPPVIEEKDEE